MLCSDKAYLCLVIWHIPLPHVCAEVAVREYIQVLFGIIYLSNSSNDHNLCRCLSDELAHLKTTI